MTEFERKIDRKLILSIIAAGIMSFSGVVTENRYSCVNLSHHRDTCFFYTYISCKASVRHFFSVSALPFSQPYARSMEPRNDTSRSLFGCSNSSVGSPCSTIFPSDINTTRSATSLANPIS